MLQGFNAYALLDFVGERADDLAVVAAYADATENLISELAPNDPTIGELQKLETSTRNLKSLAGEVVSLDQMTKDFIKNSTSSNEDILRSIRHTTQMIRTAKSIMTKLTLLRTKGILALNQMKTHLGVQELNTTNRSILIELRKQNIRAMNEKIQERKQFEDFFKAQNESMKKAKGT